MDVCAIILLSLVGFSLLTPTVERLWSRLTHLDDIVQTHSDCIKRKGQESTSLECSKNVQTHHESIEQHPTSLKYEEDFQPDQSCSKGIDESEQGVIHAISIEQQLPTSSEYNEVKPDDCSEEMMYWTKT